MVADAALQREQRVRRTRVRGAALRLLGVVAAGGRAHRGDRPSDVARRQ
jgi:hypothetical protein